MEADEPLSFFRSLDLHNIEPFTIVIYQLTSLQELRWDGSNRYEKSLDITGNYIWSSSTLYTDEVIAKRENMFARFIHSPDVITAATIHDFHASNNGDAENGFVISRETGMKTFSITQAVVQNETLNFLHADLLQQKRYTETIHINKAAIKI